MKLLLYLFPYDWINHDVLHLGITEIHLIRSKPFLKWKVKTLLLIALLPVDLPQISSPSFPAVSVDFRIFYFTENYLNFLDRARIKTYMGAHLTSC